MKGILLSVAVAPALLLSACTSTAAAQPRATDASTSTMPAFATQTPTAPTAAPQSTSDPTRVDEQGMVAVVVKPINLDSPSDTLEFEVGLNTHSVDLSMDLAALSTLTTDTGISVQATKWDAERGGHHVGGRLIFPANKDGKPVLDDASKLTLTIVNLDAPVRTFEWQLP